MELALTKDLMVIGHVMLDGEILSKTNVDVVDIPERLSTYPKDTLVLAAWHPNGSEVMGLHLFNYKNKRMNYHPMLLKPYRAKFGRDFFKKGLEWYFENVSSDSLYAEIPVSHKSTVNLAKHLGFEPVSVENDKQLLRL